MHACALLIFVALLSFANVGRSQTQPAAEQSKPRQLTIANKAWTI